MLPAISLRNTVWIAAALVLVAAPHAERLPLWLSVFTAFVFGWRLYIARMRLGLPAKWLLIFVVAAGTAAIYLHYRALFGRDAGVALLTLMIGLKLLETRTHRDGMILIFIGYFLVITNFLYDQSIPTALYMLGCVWFITAAMIGLQYKQEPANYRSQLRTSAVLLAQSAPLMVVLFVLFPRMPGPLWGMPADAYSGLTGLSDNMAPGTLNRLALSDEVAFRVAFESDAPPRNKLYWRGPVMWDFDGRSWKANRMIGRSTLESRAAPVRYTITVEPHNQRWLFALDIPGIRPPRSTVTADYQLLSFTPVNTRLRYDMESHLDYVAGVDTDQFLLRRALELPRGYNPRTLEFARTLRERFSDDAALVQEVLTMFRNQNYVYTLEPPLLGRDSVDDFLFNTRRGFCEHYSSAFTILMRAAGIPARVVTGYLGGEINPMGNYMIVRQSEAHAWSEVWLQGRGWVRIDPTQAVSPARVESGITASLPESDLAQRRRFGDFPLLNQLRLTWDSIANSWNQTVLGYNFERQREWMFRAGLDDATWRTLAFLLIAFTATISLIVAAMTFYARRRQQRDPTMAIYETFCARLARAGLARNHNEGPFDYAARVARTRPDLAAAAQTITTHYVELRYGILNKNKYLNDFRALVNNFSA